MPIPRDYLEIIDDLIAKTQKGRAGWQSAPFGVELNVQKDMKIGMWGGKDENTDEPFVSVALQDAQGKNIDNWYVDGSDADFARMNLFFSDAKRHALGVPQRLIKLRELIRSADFIGGTDMT